MVEDMETVASLLEAGVWARGTWEVDRAGETADGVAASLRCMVADMAGLTGGVYGASTPPPLPPLPPPPLLPPLGPTFVVAGGGGPASPADVAARLRDAVSAFGLYRRRYLRPVCDASWLLLRQSAVALEQGGVMLAAADLGTAAGGAPGEGVVDVTPKGK